MPVQGVSHITFIVRDLDRMATFLCEGLGAKEVYDSKAKNFSLAREKFFVLGDTWLAAMEGEPPTERTYRHLALKVEADELLYFEARLRAIGAEVKEARPRVPGEGQSLYFYDFDNHLFELHTGTLEERLRNYSA
ncbi:FosX/FosE/FosI family fosfomycin resistance hydrolase [Polaromonas sp. A23]|uniref:FosX/FosE/FosI family fosfomycin resistance hydrolase n=1 Tax=Polaromonas sp. A23 TaxID=1944133 RepID=UPI0009856D51|nr:FosX/FosE/FosI family fosfomycin resistance hydrolase [Polaromonas sp. A23]OOG47531.1 FosX/FosE/FosI family fosfomycin resistance thiol transferase [Polaromonas sp. A23]